MSMHVVNNIILPTTTTTLPVASFLLSLEKSAVFIMSRPAIRLEPRSSSSHSSCARLRLLASISSTEAHAVLVRQNAWQVLQEALLLWIRNWKRSKKEQQQQSRSPRTKKKRKLQPLRTSTTTPTAFLGIEPPWLIPCLWSPIQAERRATARLFQKDALWPQVLLKLVLHPPQSVLNSNHHHHHPQHQQQILYEWVILLQHHALILKRKQFVRLIQRLLEDCLATGNPHMGTLACLQWIQAFLKHNKDRFSQRLLWNVSSISDDNDDDEPTPLAVLLQLKYYLKSLPCVTQQVVLQSVLTILEQLLDPLGQVEALKPVEDHHEDEDDDDDDEEEEDEDDEPMSDDDESVVDSEMNDPDEEGDDEGDENVAANGDQAGKNDNVEALVVASNDTLEHFSVADEQAHHHQDSDDEGDDADMEDAEMEDTAEHPPTNSQDDEPATQDDDDDDDEDVRMDPDDEDSNDDADGEHVVESQDTGLYAVAGEQETDHPTASDDDDDEATAELGPSLEERKEALITASMQVLERLYPPHNHHSPTGGGKAQTYNHHHRQEKFMNTSGELALLKNVNNLIRPLKKTSTTKIILRRAPTQEEFFGGSLSRNPITISSLKPSTADPSYEPTVADLRQHIADDLQMSDSAELIEILVANKILNIHLKLRVVHDVVWRQHLIEHSSSSISSAAASMGGGTLSMIFSSGLVSERLPFGRDGAADLVQASTPATALPSMIATYRLAGVDGEATEDTVNSLADPEAPSESTIAEEKERLLEEQFGLTRLITAGRGIFILLRSIQNAVADMLRRIRRDDVDETTNPSREKFKSSAPCSSLVLLRHCCQLQSNRKLLLGARAPTVLLTLLLEVLKVLEEGSASNHSGSSNPTTDILQELIESLTCDISASDDNPGTFGEDEGYESDVSQDAASMPLLLESIETISLSPPLRQVIAKLLPFLTYGQTELSRTLAKHFDRNITVENLGDGPDESEGTKSSVLMDTFVETAVSLPCNQVCNSLRSALIHCGFVDRLTKFISKDMPKQPPTWSPALWAKGELPISPQKKKGRGRTNTKSLEEQWRDYFARAGLRKAFQIITGLCKKHAPTIARAAEASDFILACHWMESTLDNTTLDISTGGLGLLSETLLDEMAEGNDKIRMVVDKVRMRTRLQKKALAEERRTKALAKMTNSFHSSTGTGSLIAQAASQTGPVRGAAASLLSPVFGLFRESNPAANNDSSSAGASKARSTPQKDSAKPSWMAEMENMVDDDGLSCAICQEGRTVQPTELLGLYAYVKKVVIPSDQCGSRQAIDGTMLLKALPAKMPESLIGDPLAEEWFLVARACASNLLNSDASSSQLANSRKNIVYTTTVSAGNAIHLSCHRAARLADRNHSKAPKSEWEGAALRNSRVACNVILPLVSSKSSAVSLVAIDSAFSEYQKTITNLLGSTPKSMLWNTIHDTRLLLLRIAHGEALNADCGGGSLASNCQLLYYQLVMAEMVDKDAQVDQPRESQHARGLPCGFLAASSMLISKDGKETANSTTLLRGMADSAPMAALASIVFHNSAGESAASSSTSTSEHVPYPKRMWLLGRDYFLRGLVICAGRRHALGTDGSGCHQTPRAGVKRARSHSFAEWDVDEDESEEPMACTSSPTVHRSSSATNHRRRSSSSNSRPSIVDFSHALRPMLTLYAILDQLSIDFDVCLTDVMVEEASSRLVQVIERCQRAKNIFELLEHAKVTLEPDEMVELLQKGMVAA